MTFLELQTKINDNQVWPAEAKKAIAVNLPQAGSNLIAFVDREIDSTGSEFVAAYLAQLVDMSAAWHQDLASRKVDRILNDIRSGITDPNMEFGKYLLPVILDIRQNNALNASLPPNLSQAMDVIEAKFFDRLPEVEMENILHNRLLWFSKYTNLLMEMKQYCYMRSSDNSPYDYQKLLKILDSNIERFGDSFVNGNKEEVPNPTVKDWIQDFLQSTAGNFSSRSVYDVAKYLTTGANPKKLQKADSELLSEVLKIYSWMTKPTISESELDEYRELKYQNEGVGFDEAGRPAIIKPGLMLDETNISRTIPDISENLQKKTMQDISAKAPQISYNGARQPEIYKGPRGLALSDTTNIIVEEEEKRLKSEREENQASIESKLKDLRMRKQK